jgi:hypothetical protein
VRARRFASRDRARSRTRTRRGAARRGAARRGAWRLIPRFATAGSDGPHQEHLVEARKPRTPWLWRRRRKAGSCGSRPPELPRSLGRAQEHLSPVNSGEDWGSGAELAFAKIASRKPRALDSLFGPGAASSRIRDRRRREPRALVARAYIPDLGGQGMLGERTEALRSQHPRHSRSGNGTLSNVRDLTALNRSRTLESGDDCACAQSCPSRGCFLKRARR